MKINDAIKKISKIPKCSVEICKDYLLIDDDKILKSNSRTTIRIKVDEFSNIKGKFLISFENIKKLIKIKNIKSFEIKDDLFICNGSIKVKFPIRTDVEEYPELNFNGDSIGSFSTPNYDISYYCYTDKPTVDCVHLDSNNKRLVATNGHILKIQNNIVNVSENILINKDSFKLLDLNKSYNVIKNDRLFITIVDNDIEYRFETLDEKYPNIDQVIPKLDKTIPISISELKDVIKEILPFTNKKTNLIKFEVGKINPPFNSIKISAFDRESDITVEKNINCNDYEEQNIRGFNGEYLLHILNEISENSLFYFNDSKYIDKITEAHYFIDNNNDSLSLIMPLRILED